MVDHVFLYSPIVEKLAQLHRDNEFGELQFIDSVRINLGMVQQDVNVIWDLAPHDLSIFDYILGRGPQSVLTTASAGPGKHLAAVAHLTLDYGDGLIASVHVNWLSPVKIRHLLIGGSRHSALYNDLEIWSRSSSTIGESMLPSKPKTGGGCSSPIGRAMSCLLRSIRWSRSAT